MVFRDAEHAEINGFSNSERFEWHIFGNVCRGKWLVDDPLTSLLPSYRHQCIRYDDVATTMMMWPRQERILTQNGIPLYMIYQDRDHIGTEWWCSNGVRSLPFQQNPLHIDSSSRSNWHKTTEKSWYETIGYVTQSVVHYIRIHITLLVTDDVATTIEHINAEWSPFVYDISRQRSYWNRMMV